MNGYSALGIEHRKEKMIFIMVWSSLLADNLVDRDRNEILLSIWML
jgi:hypothetical protein